MTFDDIIKNEYFEWLYEYVCGNRAHDDVSYKNLFTLLHQIEFTFSISKDVNRARDGVDLRYRFAMTKNDEYITEVLDGPCSVLEMMVALSIRCEETIMYNTLYGDRTCQWFWSMMKNLGIDYMTDDFFNSKEAYDKIYNFLERRYEPNGKGGLFYIRGCKDDLRDVEIWTQLCWYLDKFE